MSIPTSIKNTLNNSGFDTEMIYKLVYDYNCLISGDAVIKALSENLNTINHRLYKVKDLHLWTETNDVDYYDQNIEAIENLAYSYGYIYQSEIDSEDLNNYNYIDIMPYILPRYLLNVKCICFSKVENLWNIPFTNRIGDYRFFLFKVSRNSTLPLGSTTPYENIINILNNTFISIYNSYYHKNDMSSNIFFEIQNNKLNAVITFCPIDMLDNLNNLHIKEYISIIIKLNRKFNNFNLKLPVHNNLEYLKIYLSIQYFIQLNDTREQALVGEGTREDSIINGLICVWNNNMDIINSNITLKYINILDDFKFTDIYNEFCRFYMYANYDKFIENYNNISLYDCMNYMNLITPIQYSDSFLTGYNRIEFYSNLIQVQSPEEATTGIENSPPQIISNEYLDYSDYEDEFIEEEFNEDEFIEDFEDEIVEDIDLNTILPDIYDSINLKDLYTKYINYIENELGLINLNIELRNNIKLYKDKLLDNPICNQGLDVLIYTDFGGKEINKVKDFIIESNPELKQDEIKEIENYKIIGLFSPENNTMLCFELKQELSAINTKKVIGIIAKTRQEAEKIKLRNEPISFVSFSIFNKMFIPKNIFEYLPFKSKQPIHSVYLLIDTTLLWFDTNPVGISSYHNDEQGDKLYIIIPLDLFDF